jgi:hypothetical protein
MLKFMGGLLAGIVLALGYVRFDFALPEFLEAPEKLRGGVVSAAIEEDLYDLAADSGRSVRALEVYFENRAEAAAELDAEVGHPFLSALRRMRAMREARQLSMQWSAYDAALTQDALRDMLVRKHGTAEEDALKRAMLMEALQDRSFLQGWLTAEYGTVTEDNLRDLLARASVAPG